MICEEAVFDVADNSGAQKVRCIKFVGTKTVWLGSVMTVVVSKASTKSKIKKGEMCKAIVVRLRRKTVRPDGSAIKFDENAVVLFNSAWEMIGTRVFGSVGREVRKTNPKIVSLAQEVL